MLYKTENGVAVPYANLSNGIDADRLSIVDTEGLVTTAGGDTTGQLLIDEIADEVVSLNTSLANKVNTSDIANNLTTTASGKVLDARQGKVLFESVRRERKQIVASQFADLCSAISEQNLGKYGFAIGDWFESPTERTLKQQSGNPVTETNVNVKLKYYLADMDTYYGGYSAYAIANTHHIAIVVDTQITRQWHTGDASSVGYSGSLLHTYLKGDVLNAIKLDIAALTGDSWNNHLIDHSKLFTTALENWAWAPTNQLISALTESEIYGHTEWSVNGYQEGEAVKPLELFQKYRWDAIFGNNWVWLRNMKAASDACLALGDGFATSNGVTGKARAAGLILFH